MTQRADVLVALEPNEEAAHIWRSADQFASQAWPDATINRQALSVVSPIVEVYTDMNFTPLASHSSEWSQELLRTQGAELVRLLQSVDADLDAETQVSVVEGYPAACISEMAATKDLVVMGLHNRSGIRRMLGSTTHSVLNQCDRDLLAIHPDSSHPDGYARILLCVDSTSMAQHVIEQSIPLLSRAVDYQVLCAIPPINSIYTSVYGDFGLGSDYAAIEQELVAHAQRRVESLLNEAGLDAGKTTATRGDPIDTITQAASTQNSDLIVMGANQRSALNRLLLGSTCRGVLQATPTDVLVMRFPA